MARAASWYCVLLFKRIYYASVLCRRDEICLVKFLFTFSREYFILSPFLSVLLVLLPIHRARYFSFVLSCAGRCRRQGTQFPQFLLISILVVISKTSSTSFLLQSSYAITTSNLILGCELCKTPSNTDSNKFLIREKSPNRWNSFTSSLLRHVNTTWKSRLNLPLIKYRWNTYEVAMFIVVRKCR